MGIIYPELDKLYWSCSDDEGNTCAEPTSPHVIIRRDYENVPWCEVVLKDHSEAVQASVKINEYLKDFSDEEIFIIQSLTDSNLSTFLASMDEELREARVDYSELNSSPIENHI